MRSHQAESEVLSLIGRDKNVNRGFGQSLFTISGIVKMHEEIIDRQKELRTEQMHLHSVLHDYLIFCMEDGERVRIRGTYFNRDTRGKCGGTIRYTIPYKEK
jgi:hypothetical protein